MPTCSHADALATPPPEVDYKKVTTQVVTFFIWHAARAYHAAPRVMNGTHKFVDYSDELLVLINYMLGTNPRSALQAYARFFGPESRWLEERVLNVAIHSGWSDADIGELLGVTRQAVQKRRHQYESTRK